MSIVCGIDPSLTSTGIAILQDGQPITLTTVGHHTRNGASYAHRSDRIVSQCRAVIEAIHTALATHEPQRRATNSIDLAVIEGPAYAHANAYTHDGAGLWWGLYSALRAKHVPTAVIAPQTRAKWATGIGNADKATVLTAVRTWWPETTIRNHDIADALVLALLGSFHRGYPMPFELKPRHYAALETITWPEVTNA